MLHAGVMMCVIVSVLGYFHGQGRALAGHSDASGATKCLQDSSQFRPIPTTSNRTGTLCRQIRRLASLCVRHWRTVSVVV